MHKLQWNTWFQAQVLVSFDKRSNILRVTWIIARKHQLPHWSPDGDQLLLCKASYCILCQGNNSTHRSFPHLAQPPFWSVTNRYQSTCVSSGASASVAQHQNPEDLCFNYCSEHLRSCEHQLDKDADVSLSMTVLMSLVMWGEKYSEVTHCVYLLFLCSSLVEL